MSSLVFLGIAVAVTLLGWLVLWARNRPPRSVDAHIRAFERELEALAPESPPARTRPHGRSRTPKRGRRSG